MSDEHIFTINSENNFQLNEDCAALSGRVLRVPSISACVFCTAPSFAKQLSSTSSTAHAAEINLHKNSIAIASTSGSSQVIDFNQGVYHYNANQLGNVKAILVSSNNNQPQDFELDSTGHFNYANSMENVKNAWGLTLPKNSELFSRIWLQLNDIKPSQLIPNGSIRRSVSWVSLGSKNNYLTTVKQILIIPMGNLTDPTTYLVCLLNAPVAPIIISSIRLLARTVHVFRTLETSRKQIQSSQLLMHNKRANTTDPKTANNEPIAQNTINICEQQMLDFMWQGYAPLVIIDESFHIKQANNAFKLLMNLPVKKVIQHLDLQAFVFFDRPLTELLNGIEDYEVKGCDMFGTSLSLKLRVSALNSPANNEFLMMFKPITEAANTPLAPNYHPEQLSAIFDMAVVGIFEVNKHGECIFANAFLEDLLGRNIADHRPMQWAEVFLPADREKIINLMKADLVFAGGFTKHCQIVNERGDRRWVRFHVCANSEKDTGFVGTITDETALRLQEIKLRELAEQDQLTGLVNRRVVETRLKQTISNIPRYGPIVLMSLDLDGFKDINDSLGHDIGDLLLVEVAGRIKSAVREIDLVARMGGDEFVVLLANGVSEMAGARVSTAIIDEVRKPYALAGRILYITVSTGIVLCEDISTTPAKLLKQADMALYKAKAQGRNNFQFYTSELDDAAKMRLDVIMHLHEALKREAFQIEYQPQVCMHTAGVYGLEALIRWHPEDNVVVKPNDFIGLLEETGIIHDVGYWVIDNAMAAFAGLYTKELISATVKLSLNISIKQLMLDDFLDKLLELCNRFEIAPNRVVLELNEVSFAEKLNSCRGIFYSLKDNGFLLAIDDFGTGFSSVQLLKSMHIDFIKIDIELINGIFENEDDLAVVNAIVEMAKRLAIQVIAVGVDHPAKINYLRDIGCNVYQGFICSKPLGVDALEHEFLAHHRVYVHQAS